MAIREARYELKKSPDTLVAVRDAGKCKHCGRGASSVDEVVRAAMGILKLSGIEREKPRTSKRSTFSVVHATAEEQAAKVAERVGIQH